MRTEGKKKKKRKKNPKVSTEQLIVFSVTEEN